MREKMVKMKFTDFECNLLINGFFNGGVFCLNVEHRGRT